MLDIDNLTPNIIEVYKENAKKQIWKGQVKYINQVFHIFRCNASLETTPVKMGRMVSHTFRFPHFSAPLKSVCGPRDVKSFLKTSTKAIPPDQKIPTYLQESPYWAQTFLTRSLPSLRIF